MLNSCSWIMDDDSECGERCEGNTPFCGSHNRQLRREEAEVKKQVEKRNTLIAKQREKNQSPRAKINKVSPKREEINKEYFKLVEQFKHDNPNCKAKVNEYCTGSTDDPHHSRGRGVYLLDVSTWIPVCRSCHNYIEQHPADALKRGLSFSRLAERQKDNEFQDVVDKRFNDML